jgi:hypothetical protein
MGRGGGSGGWRGSDEHLFLLNAPVQEKPDAPGFAELVHLRALNALKSPPPHYVKFFFIKNKDKQQLQQEQGPPPQWRPFKYLLNSPTAKQWTFWTHSWDCNLQWSLHLHYDQQFHHVPVACIGCYCCGGCVSEWVWESDREESETERGVELVS